MHISELDLNIFLLLLSLLVLVLVSHMLILNNE